MKDAKVDQYGNVMVYENGKWVKNTSITNRIKLAIKRDKVKDLLGTVNNNVKITQEIINKVNQKLMIAEKGRGVTGSLTQETGPKNKPLYKDKPPRTEPKAPPKDTTAKAREAIDTKQTAKEAQKLKTPEFEIFKKVTDGKPEVKVLYKGEEDASLKKAMWKIVQNPNALKGKESIRIGNKSVPISILRQFWKAMPKEVSKSIVTKKPTPKGGVMRGGVMLTGGGGLIEQIK